jgi:DNA-binding PadR family transcriptional regulator
MEELAAEGLVSRTADAAGTQWFQLTAKGRQELDANWVEE